MRLLRARRGRYPSVCSLFGYTEEKRGNCGKPMCAAPSVLLAYASSCASVEEEVGPSAEGSCRSEEGLVRRVLLPLQPALCSEPRRALRDLPARPSRRPAPAAPAALHLPPGPPHARRVGLPQRGRAGRPAPLGRSATPTRGLRPSGASPWRSPPPLATRTRIRRSARRR